MSISFAQYLLDAQPEYDGHKQTELQSMSFQDIRQLCLDLEEITGESFTFELWVEGGRNHKDSGTIYRQRTTKENQIILGIEEVLYDTVSESKTDMWVNPVAPVTEEEEYEKERERLKKEREAKYTLGFFCTKCDYHFPSNEFSYKLCCPECGHRKKERYSHGVEIYERVYRILDGEMHFLHTIEEDKQ